MKMSDMGNTQGINFNDLGLGRRRRRRMPNSNWMVKTIEYYQVIKIPDTFAKDPNIVKDQDGNLDLEQTLYTLSYKIKTMEETVKKAEEALKHFTMVNDKVNTLADMIDNLDSRLNIKTDNILNI